MTLFSSPAVSLAQWRDGSNSSSVAVSLCRIFMGPLATFPFPSCRSLPPVALCTLSPYCTSGVCKQIDESIERYVGQTASADRQEATIAKDETQRLQDKIAALKEEMARLKKLEVWLLQAPDPQVSLTDPDARSMATPH